MNTSIDSLKIFDFFSGIVHSIETSGKTLATFLVRIFPDDSVVSYAKLSTPVFGVELAGGPSTGKSDFGCGTSSMKKIMKMIPKM